MEQISLFGLTVWFRLPTMALGLAWLLLIAVPPELSSQMTLRLDSFPLPGKPMGVALASLPVSPSCTGCVGPVIAAVANAESNSLSLIRVLGENRTGSTPVLLGTVGPIAAPYGVAACTVDNVGDRVLVTSPTDGSVTVVDLANGRVLGRISVGPQPHAVTCYRNDAHVFKGLVSTVGDDSLVVVDVPSLTVEGRILGVMGSKALHGIDVYQGSQAWVAATQADTVTIVDLRTYRVLTRVPVRQPTSVRTRCVSSASDSMVRCYNQSLDVVSQYSAPIPKDFITASPEDGLAGGRGGMSFRLVINGPTNSVSYLSTFFVESEQGTFPGLVGAEGMESYNPPGGTSSSRPCIVAVTSPDSNRLYLVQKAPTTPTEFSISGAASFVSRVGPGALASLFGVTGVTMGFTATALPLPQTLGGVSVRVGGSLSLDSTGERWNYSPADSIEAPLLYVGPSQINIQIPPGIEPGDFVPAQLRRPDGTTLLSTFRVVLVAPGIFTLLQNGSGQAAALNQDNTLNGNPQSIVGARHAARGTVIQIFATGAGATNPAVAAGVAAPANPLALTVVQPTVTIGGRTAQVQFSGLAPGLVGLWQINAVIPADVTPGNAVSLSVAAGGQTSNTVTIAVQ